MNTKYSGINIPEIDLYDFAVSRGLDLMYDLGAPIPGHSEIQETVDMLTGKKK